MVLFDIAYCHPGYIIYTTAADVRPLRTTSVGAKGELQTFVEHVEVAQCRAVVVVGQPDCADLGAIKMIAMTAFMPLVPEQRRGRPTAVNDFNDFTEIAI